MMLKDVADYLRQQADDIDRRIAGQQQEMDRLRKRMAEIEGHLSLINGEAKGFRSAADPLDPSGASKPDGEGRVESQGS